MTMIGFLVSWHILLDRKLLAGYLLHSLRRAWSSEMTVCLLVTLTHSLLEMLTLLTICDAFGSRTIVVSFYSNMCSR